jgi:hypothetical protein
MGQQQLLLLVLGIVIVGLAVVVGIQAFDSSSQQAEVDAITMDMFRILSDAKAWTEKPAAFGGGGGSALDWEYLDLGYVNVSGTAVATGETYTTANAVYSDPTSTAGSVTITAPHPNGTNGAVITGVYTVSSGDIAVSGQ